MRKVVKCPKDEALPLPRTNSELSRTQWEQFFQRAAVKPKVRRKRK